MWQRQIVFITAMTCLLLASATDAGEHQGTCSAGRDYFVYTPDTIDPDTTYTLILSVHGYRGNGRGGAGMRGYVNEFDCIVLSPSYDSNGYQYLEAGSVPQTMELIGLLRDEYNLHEKIFVFGFSGGAQFVHRFAMANPGLVAGCAAHSAGTWGTGDYDRAVPNPAARGVLFAISCGENDTGKSFGEAPMGRLEWAQRYAGMLEDGGFLYDAQWWPGVGHSRSRGANEMTRDCYVASTQLIPELTLESRAIEGALLRREYAQAWAMIQERRASEEAEGITARLIERYLESLEPLVERIDRWAETQVRSAIRENRDPDDRREALTALQRAYEGLPGATRLIERSLEQ